MGWLFTLPDSMDPFVDIRATSMEDARSYGPPIKTKSAEKLPWAVTGAVRRLERFSTAEAFRALLTQYGGQG